MGPGTAAIMISDRPSAGAAPGTVANMIAAPPIVQIGIDHEALVGDTVVRRALPRHERRMIGAWCFADHFGPDPVPPGAGMQVGHPQPETTRHGAAAFEHHGELPVSDLGTGTATVLVGTLGDATSPARSDTAQVGAQLDLARRDRRHRPPSPTSSMV